MLTKIKLILAICMVLVLIILPEPILALNNQVYSANAYTPETTTPLISRVEQHTELNPTPGKALIPSSLTLPQPEWQSLNFPVLPPPRIGSSFAINPINKVALLFGGLDSSTGELNDLWLTNGLSWIQFQTPHTPEVRSDASMAYDEAHRVMLLFGGSHSSTLLGDTWSFNGVDWTQQQPQTAPSPRTDASMAYDADRNLTILFGGLVNTGVASTGASNEMWVWDGMTWQQQFPAILPPARSGANMVYDRARNTIVLFGGGIEGGFRDDTWIWDGSNWIEQRPLHHPDGRANFGMAYDESRQHVVLFGGQSSAGVDATETWVWDGQDWSLLPTRQSPPLELTYGAQLVYLPDLQTVVLYNDLREKTAPSTGNATFAEHSEVWTLTYHNWVYLPFIGVK